MDARCRFPCNSPRTAARSRTLPTRVVRLDLLEADDIGRRFLNIRIFHLDTVYWIRTRVLPGVSLKGLLFHLIDEIAKREIATLPANLFHYNIFEMSREMVLLPDLTVEDVAGPLLYVHESEFYTAFDRRRRMELVADAVRQIEKQLPPELVGQPPETVKELQASVPDASGSETLPIATIRSRREPPPAASLDPGDSSGWAYWQRMVG
jgi:hypothetical protein